MARQEQTVDSTRTLRLTEIFYSIQGESTHAGRPCIFIRTTGCDLRCEWCDTEYAFTGGKKWQIGEILGHVAQWPCRLVELTGGEPLLQPALPELARALLHAGYTVLIETGGHRDISVLEADVIKIVDVKCPGSGESDANRWENLELLRAQDQVKFVVRDRADYEWARDVVLERLQGNPAQVLFSPVFGVLEPVGLSEWLMADGLEARMQLQMHKFIWDPQARGV